MNGEKFLIFTTEQGGYFKVHRITEEEYQRIKETREYSYYDFSQTQSLDGKAHVVPYFIALGTIEDNFDFGLGCSREMAKAAWRNDSPPA